MTFEDPQDFVESWVDTFTTDYSYKNPLYGRGALHVILGRCLINQRITKRGAGSAPRVSMFYLQGPSSGKSSGYSMIYEVLDALDIEIMSPDEITDAALIGTVEQTTDEHGNQTWEEEPGVLAEAEVFHFDEASIILDPKEYQQNMMTYLQKALNPIGSEQNKISKNLAHGEEIVVRPNCSLLLTSYMPEGLEDTVINTGFLQRMLVIPRQLTIETRKEQTIKDIEALGEDSQDADLRELINELKSIKRHYQEPKEFYWHRAKPVLRKYAQDMYDLIEGTPLEVRRVLEGFIPRMIEQLSRLSVHYCCIRRDTTIMPSDVRQSADLVIQTLHMIIYWLEENPELRGEQHRASIGERYRQLLDVVSDREPTAGEYYGVSGIMPGITSAWNISETSVYRWIHRFEQKGWVEVRYKDNAKFIKITR